MSDAAARFALALALAPSVAKDEPHANGACHPPVHRLRGGLRDDDDRRRPRRSTGGGRDGRGARDLARLGALARAETRASPPFPPPASSLPIAPLETDPLAFAARVRRKLGEPSAIANLVAYDAVVPSCFGDDWALLTDAQRLEVSILLRRLMEKTLDARRKKTTSYDTAVTVLSEDAQGARVRTLSRARANPTEPSWRIDFVLHRSPEGFRVVDVVTEGSSMVKNYRDQFHEMLRRDDQGYDYLARKLRAKVERT